MPGRNFKLPQRKWGFENRSLEMLEQHVGDKAGEVTGWIWSWVIKSGRLFLLTSYERVEELFPIHDLELPQCLEITQQHWRRGNMRSCESRAQCGSSDPIHFYWIMQRERNYKVIRISFKQEQPAYTPCIEENRIQ